MYAWSFKKSWEGQTRLTLDRRNPSGETLVATIGAVATTVVGAGAAVTGSGTVGGVARAAPMSALKSYLVFLRLTKKSFTSFASVGRRTSTKGRPGSFTRMAARACSPAG